MKFNVNPAGPASAESIEELEQLLGTALPDDYKKYLAAYNGGMPEFLEYWLPHPQGKWIETVDSMLRIDEVISQSQLAKMNSESGYPDFPHGLIPIAENGCGDVVFLSVRDSDFGSVLHRFHEEANPDDDLNFGLYQVGSSFDEWVNSLSRINADTEADSESMPGG